MSIKTGTVTASVILRKLSAYPRQNGLALALRELGKLERTLFTLQWLQDPELRRRSHVGLNKRPWSENRADRDRLRLPLRPTPKWVQLYRSIGVVDYDGGGFSMP